MSAPSLDPGFDVDSAPIVLHRHTEILELLAEAAPLQRTLSAILTSLEELLPGTRGSVLLLDAATRRLHHGAAPSLPAAYLREIDGLVIGPLAGSCGTAAYLGQQVVAEDVHRDERWGPYREAARGAGLRSCWSSPIPGRSGDPVGTFAVYRDQPHRPSAREQALVGRFTHLAGIAIEHARVISDLRESEERFRRAFEDNAVGMLMVGLDVCIQRCNRGMTDLAGRDEAALVGRDLAELFVAEDRGRVRQALDGPSRSSRPREATRARLVRPDGTTRTVEVTASLVVDADQRPARLCVNVLDRTEREAAERDRRARLEAEVARRAAERQGRAKSQLLATVSHEARTPLQAITGFAELLGTLELDEDRRREALHGITTAAGHVLELLTDVLDISRLEVGALPVAPERLAASEVIAEVAGVMAAEAATRGVALHTEPGGVEVVADRRRLRQIVLNLVANAVRYGRTVTVRATRDGDRAAIDVVDDGDGIPEVLLPVLFTPFERGELDRSEEVVEGYGLGLALAHGLARAIDGELTVDTVPGVGTTMRVMLPVPPGAA